MSTRSGYRLVWDPRWPWWLLFILCAATFSLALFGQAVLHTNVGLVMLLSYLVLLAGWGMGAAMRKITEWTRDLRHMEQLKSEEIER